MLEVKLSIQFAIEFERYPAKDVALIGAFMTHCETAPLMDWIGKVGPSWKVPSDYQDRALRVAYAKQHKLWHAHVGYPHWKDSKNEDAEYKTSDYVVHFTYTPGDTFLKVVDYSDHGDPFRLPTENYLVGEV